MGVGLVEEKRDNKIAGQGNKYPENYVERKINDGIWWRIKIRLNDSFYPGWVGWALKKVGIIKKNEYRYEDSIDVTTTVDADGNPTTTIIGKE